jgi:F420-0:gamma-glutamyl ligase-like protein
MPTKGMLDSRAHAASRMRPGRSARQFVLLHCSALWCALRGAVIEMTSQVQARAVLRKAPPNSTSPAHHSAAVVSQTSYSSNRVDDSNAVAPASKVITMPAETSPLPPHRLAAELAGGLRPFLPA